MTPKSLTPRRAFTLIELLVVIAIMATLMALLAAAVMRMLTVPPHKNTELLIQKLAASLEQQWAAVNTQCRTENVNESPYTAAYWAQAQAFGPDPERIMGEYVRLRRLQEFPTTVNNAVAGGKTIYMALNGVTAPTTPQGNSSESSMCLFLALTVGRRGMEFNPGTLAPKESRVLVGDLKGLFDGWDQPLMFVNDGTKFAIISAGPNQRFGDADDISSETLRLGK